MDLPIPGTNSPLPTAAVFADNAQDFLGIGALQINPTATIVVNSIDDTLNSSPGVTTFRDAINKANADSGEDLIVFDRSLFSTAQTITLKLGELDITHDLDIIAPRDTLTGGDLVTVSGNNASRVFEIDKGATVNLFGLIVADGSVTSDSGSGIKNFGTLTLDQSIVRNNSANRNNNDNSSNGGGIYSIGTITIDNSIITGNSAGYFGGGIYNNGALKVNNSTINNNSSSFIGGGIFNNISSSTVEINNSTISDNSAFSSAGGIYTFNRSSTIKVNNSTISGNSARESGGISNGSILEVNNSTISNNSGSDFSGGILNVGTLKVNHSTISGNSTLTNFLGQGGGIYNSGTLMVGNSTISGNSANFGGGIYNDYSGTLTLLFSTLTQNIAANGGGIYQNDVPPRPIPVIVPRPRGSNSVRNTIISSNLNRNNGINPDVSGTFTSLGYNLIGNSTGSTGFGVKGDIVGTSANPINPGLDILNSNGGSTQTIALLPGSPAINAGDPTILPTDPTTDQRGRQRTRRGRVDIGAFESSLKK